MVVYGTIGRNDGGAAAAEERTEEEAKKVVAKVLSPERFGICEYRVEMKELFYFWEPQFFSNITKPWESIDDLQGKKKK